MKFMRALSVFGLALAVNGAAFASDFADRDPVGEKAHYVLDRASSRTTSLIASGVADAMITRAVPEAEEGPAYEVKLDYDFNIRFAGRQRGTQAKNVEESFFAPEFMSDLRARGEYVGTSFKMRHLGYANVRNLDGRSYENCDKIMIYDINLNAQAPAFVHIAAEIVASAAGGNALVGTIENLQVVAHVKEGLPVVGAAKVDISGKYNGIGVKVGVDYQP